MGRPKTRQALATLAVCVLAAGVYEAGISGATLAASGPSATDPTDLPIGDGKVTTESPRREYVYVCHKSTLPPGAAGAFAEGPWIHGDGTYDLTAKAVVDGAVLWPGASFQLKVTKRRRLIRGNGLPVDETTGEFPISPSDDAYSYDRNPNSIAEQSVYYSLPRHPRKASSPGCLSGETIGVAKDGVAIFDALDAADRDAVAHETQDACQGHPQQQGVYHYHSIPTCLTAGESKKKPSGLVGYALDGYPIFGPRGAHGKLLTDADLDRCHGQTSRVYFEGRLRRIYHYNATLEYPYTIGCFHGTPQS